MMNRRGLVATSALLITLIVASTCLGQYVRPEGKTLRELAEARGKHFGANFGLLACGNHTEPPSRWATAERWEQGYQDWKAIAKDHFTILSAGWQMYPGHSWRAPDEYCLEGADRIIAWCRDNGIVFHGHGLGYIQRGWPAKIEVNTDEEAAKFREMYERYVQAFANHYKGRMYMWDMCNEHITYGSFFNKWAYFNKFNYLKAYGAEEGDHVYGLDWYLKTFALANECDPDAKLVYLDYCNEIVCPKANVMYRVARELKKRKAPIHGVGFQLHQRSNFNRVLDADPAIYGAKRKKPRQWHELSDSQFVDSMRENVRRFADLGLEIWATEASVCLASEHMGSQGEALQRQALVYRRLVEVFLEFPGFKGFKLWGVGGETNSGKKGEPGEELGLYLFDKSFEPKAAFFAVRDALEHYHPRTLANDSFDGASGVGWQSPWTFHGASVVREKGFGGGHCLRLRETGDTAVRSINLSKTYNAHLAYRWRAEGFPAEDAPLTIIEVSSDGHAWRQIKTHNADELALRKIEGDWHAGYATISNKVEVGVVYIRFRMEGEDLPFLVDDLRVVADSTQD